jgi:signal peptidase I
MIIRPVWQTPSGSIGTYQQGQSLEVIFQASNTNIIELISGELPNGVRLDNENKLLEGIPTDLGISKNYHFVLRASNNTGPNNSKVIQDRSFSIIITSNSAPILLDPEGTLRVGLLNENYILNNTTVNYQFTASSPSVPKGQRLKFYVEEGEGELPPGLKLDESGLLYGTITDTLDVDFKTVQGTYDKDFYDVNPYDYGDLIESARAITTLNSGRINTVSLDYSGYGYLTAPDVIVGGSVNTVSIINAGQGYTSTPEVVFSNSPVFGGITAKGHAIMAVDTEFVTFQGTIVDGGDSDNPVTTAILDGGNAISENTLFIDSEGAGVTGDQTVYYKVVGIVITDPGTGYTSPPSISFKNQRTGFGAVAACTLRTGSGAVLSANIIDGSINNLVIVNPGSGYTTPPLISFGLPSAGSKIISKVYKFKVTVSNGTNIDSKIYSILVKSEDSLRVDTTFIFSDTREIDTSRTFIQPPIWITGSRLPSIKGDNNFTFDLEVFDPTPNIGKIFFSLMDLNFDGTESQLGPSDAVLNQSTFQITGVSLSSPTVITLSTGDVFNTGDRIRLAGVITPAGINDGIFFVKKINSFEYELYSDRILINKINTIISEPYTGNGVAKPNFSYLNLDPDGGEIYGFIPYQPEITRTYTFTVKASRIQDDLELSTTFKQFQLTVKGNIDSDISFITPTLVGELNPNELSLLKIEAKSTLTSAALNYQLVPGYGRLNDSNFIELDFNENNGNIFVEGYGINPYFTLDKGQTYKINVDLPNFSLSFRSGDSAYYNKGIRHSSGAVGQVSQEKSNGYYIFNVPYDEVSKINIKYTNTKKDGLFLTLKKFDINSRQWVKSPMSIFFNEYDALINNQSKLTTNEDIHAIFIDYQRIEIEIKKYNKQTLIWEVQDYTTTKPLNPSNNEYWLDIENSNFGVLEFQYVGIRGVWVPKALNIVTAFPNNSQGTNGDYVVYRNVGKYQVLRKINGVWKILERLTISQKGVFDPNVFFRRHYEETPITNLAGDVWFKYTSLFDGDDKEISLLIRSLDSLPTDIKLGTNGDIIGKISPSFGNTFKSYYTGNVLYIVGDIVSFNDDLYICINQNISSGSWFQDTQNWQPFFYTRRTFTSIDVNSFGAGKFSIAGPKGNDDTSIDKLLRFRVRAKDTQNVYFKDKDFNIEYNASNTVTLTNVFLKPFLKKEVRDLYFNFITSPEIFTESMIYRLEDQEFGVQRSPKMLLLGGIESTFAERYSSAVQRNYYDRPLYFGNIKKAVAIKDGKVEYEVIYVEINDPSEIGENSVRSSIKLDFEYDPLTADYTKIRMDGTSVTTLQTGLDTIFPSSISIMQEELKKVTLEKEENILIVPEYEDYGRIPELQLSGPNQGQYIDVNPVTSSEDWGNITERISLIDDFLLVIATLVTDDTYRPLWMNSTQDNTGNPIGYVKAMPICFVKPGSSDEIMAKIAKSKFDFKNLNFTIDRIIIQNAQGETGDKYIKFINREII